jgi:hypothetical protein
MEVPKGLLLADSLGLPNEYLYVLFKATALHKTIRRVFASGGNYAKESSESADTNPQGTSLSFGGLVFDCTDKAKSRTIGLTGIQL